MSKPANKKPKSDWNGTPPDRKDFRSKGFGPAVPFVDPRTAEYRPFRARTENQAEVLEIIRNHALTILIGPAGTAKTFLAAAIAMEMLQRGLIKNIVGVRPAVEAGESIGYLSGDLTAKMDPFLRPVIDNLAHFVGTPVLNQFRAQGTVEITSMTYIRGRTINDAVMILDEMQNASPAQMKMCLTRAGENCKVVVTLDPSQCDLPDDAPSAAEDLARFYNREGIAIVEFEMKDVVRSKLARTVLAAYAA